MSEEINVLVLGGNGFVGSHLVDALLRAGYGVRVFDKHPEPFRPIKKEVDYRYGSFDNPLDMAGVLDGVDLVFHLISTTLPQTSNDDPGFDVRSNLVPTLTLLDACVQARVKRVIFLSSGGTVYGNPKTLPVSEDSAKEPYCSYGVTKLAIEKYLLYYEHQFGLCSVILRPSNVYGPRQNPLGIQGAISVFMNKIKNKETVEIWGNGSVVRDYLYVEDLCAAMLAASKSKTHDRIFNIGSGQGHSLKQILDRVEKVTAKAAKLQYKDARAFDVKEIYLDIQLAKKELSFEPQIDLEEGLRRTWDFVKDLPA